MKSEAKVPLDLVGELMDNVYQMWKILYDGNTKARGELLVYVDSSIELLAKIRDKLS